MSIGEISYLMGVILFLICALWIIIPIKKNETIEESIEEADTHFEENDYIKPVLKQLTQEQIDDIHSRGKITPLEKVEEWESFDLCVPGNAIGSAKDRCHYFKHNCHECLLEYASQKKEYDKIELKAIHPYNNEKGVVLEKNRK